MAEMARQELEQSAPMVVFCPPKTFEEHFRLLTAPETFDGEVGFSSLKVSLTDLKEFLEPAVQTKLDSYLAKATFNEKDNIPAMNVIAQSAKSKSTSMAASAAGLAKAGAGAEGFSGASCNVSFADLIKEELPMKLGDERFLVGHVPDFVNEISQLHKVFEREPTRPSGPINCAFAILTGRIMGKMNGRGEATSHTGVTLDAAVPGSGFDGKLEAMKKESSSVAAKTLEGREVLGFAGLVIRLKKSRRDPSIRVKDTFFISSSQEEHLKRLMGTITLHSSEGFSAPSSRGPRKSL